TTELWSNPHYDIDTPLRDEWTGRVIGVSYDDDRIEFVYLDPQRQKLQGALQRAFPGHTVSIESCDANFAICIVGTEAPRDPPMYYYFDVATMHAYTIGPAYPQLSAADLADVRRYDYTARDGLQIPAYLTLPPGRDARNLPLVVMPHGGP